MLRWCVRSSLLLAGAALLTAAVLCDRDWWTRHVVVPACFVAPAEWKLTAVRIALATGGLGLVWLSFRVRRPTGSGIARIALALALAVCAAEVIIRLFEPPEEKTPHPRLEALLSVADARTGWSFVPHRLLRFGAPGGGPVITYTIDAHGDRAPSADWVEDPEAPTMLVTGESVALGHGVEWKDSWSALAGERLKLQVVNVAVGGYGNDQAYLRARDALARLKRPVALVSLVLLVQLHRNLQDLRAHLDLRNGELVLAPAFRPRIRLRELLFNELPLMPDGRIEKSVALTRAILLATAAAARERGARPLFVVPSFGPPRAFDAHPGAELLHAILDGLPAVLVDIDESRLMPWDRHPGPEASVQLADAVVAALRPADPGRR